MEKITTYIVIFTLGIFLGSRFFPNEKIIEKEKIVRVGFDSLFVAGLNSNITTLSKKYLAERKKNKKFELKIKLLQEKIKKRIESNPADTVSIIKHDTIFVGNKKIDLYSSPFLIGNDTLNASGIVACDLKKFYFDNVNFTYPQQKTVLENGNYLLRLFYGAVGIIIGFLLGR